MSTRPRGLHDIERSILDRYPFHAIKPHPNPVPKSRVSTPEFTRPDDPAVKPPSGNSAGWIPRYPTTLECIWCFKTAIDRAWFIETFGGKVKP